MAAVSTAALVARAALAVNVGPPAVLSTATYNQPFADLASSSATGKAAALPHGWAFSETGTSAAVDSQCAIGTGSGTAGDVYSFGSSLAPDRALGTLRSGTLTPIVGAEFVNDSGAPITALDVSYAVNLAGNRSLLSGTVTRLSIPAGATCWIRWTDFDAQSSDDGLAIDDFNVTPHAVLAPRAVLSVGDVAVDEGNSGTTTARFTVSLDRPAPDGGVTFDVATSDDTATAASGDYVARSLTGQTIPAGNSTTSRTRTASSATASTSTGSSRPAPPTTRRRTRGQPCRSPWAARSAWRR